MSGWKVKPSRLNFDCLKEVRCVVEEILESSSTSCNKNLEVDIIQSEGSVQNEIFQKGSLSSYFFKFDLDEEQKQVRFHFFTTFY